MPDPKKLHALFSFIVCAALLASCVAQTPVYTPIPTLIPVLTATQTPSPTATRTPTRTLTPTQTPIPSPTPVPTMDSNGPLQAESERALNLENFAPAQPFRVNFNHPMDPASVKTALVIYPDVPGSLAWNTANTSLTFTPASSFTPGQDYFLFLDRSLKDSHGQAFENIQQWKIHANPAPYLLDRVPDKANTMDLQPSFTLFFDRLMDRFSVEKAISVAPAIELKFSWNTASGDSGDKLTATVLHPLIPGQNYVFTLSSQATGLDGIAMQQDIRWSDRPDPLAASIDAFYATDIRISFNYALDLKDPQNSFAFDPPLPGAWDTSLMATTKTLKFIPSAPPAYAVKYTLNALAPLLSVTGISLPVFEPASGEMPPPVSGKTFPLQLKSSTETLKVYFDIQMDPEKTAAALSFNPAIPGTFEWQDQNKTLIFKPDQEWPHIENVNASIGTGAADANGHPVLSRPFTFVIQTSYSYYYAPDQGHAVFSSYGAIFQAIDANGRRAVQFVDQGPYGQAMVGLAPLSISEFAKRYLQYQNDNPYYSYYQSDDHSAFSGLTPQKTWGIKLVSNSFHELTIPADVPPGLYVLSLSDNPGFTDYLFLAVTSQTLTVKNGQERLYTWSTDFNGTPLAGMDVRLYGKQGSHLLEGQSDDNGLWSAPISTGVSVTLALASRGAPQGISLSGDVAVAALEDDFVTPNTQPGYYDYYSDPSRERAANARAYIYTDRPIYQPGQAVNFKVILRNELDARYTMPPENTPIKVSVLDVKSNPVQIYDLALDAFGSANSSFNLAQGAMLGSYSISVEALGETSSQTFEVQEYQKPEFEVTLKPSSTALAGGDQLDVDGDVSYFTGQPVQGATLSFSPLTSNNYYYPGENEQWYPSGITMPDGTTDANGHFHTSLTLPTVDNSNYGYYYDYPTSWLLQVDASDSSGATVSQGVRFTVHAAEEKVRLDTSNAYEVKAGQPIKTTMQVTDLNGNPVAGRTLDAKFTFDSWNYRGNNPVPDQSDAITTDSSGNAVVSFTPSADGWYDLQVMGTDAKGNKYADWDWFYATSSPSSARNAHSGLAISVDKSQVSPYDTVSLRIESDFGGPALLTFERGSILRTVPITLTPPVTVVIQQLGEECIPNVFVKVSAWLPSDTLSLFNEISAADTYGMHSLPEANLNTATVEIKVDAARKQLKVDLTPDKTEYQPGDEATFTLKVTDAVGQPAQAEVSLALVDEAIFSLKEDPAKPILQAFYGLRYNGTQSYDEMAPERWMWNPGGRGGGGGGGISASSPRSQFVDTALWLPDVTTDVNGQAVVKVTLPDNLTRWRLTARAITVDTLVGEAQASIVTTRSLIIRPVLPNSLTTGDRSELGALVSNTTGQPQTVQVSLQSTPSESLALESPATQSIALKAGETSLVSWTISASQAATAQVTLTALGASAEISDAIRLPLTILPLSTLFVDSSSGVLGGTGQTDLEFDTRFSVPPQFTQASGLTLTLTRSLNGSLIKSLNDLTGYPYGCVEQIMSAALPNAVVSRAFARLGATEALNKDLGNKVSQGLQDLNAMQHEDGGWGWWFDDSTDPYMTAWVLLGLSLTRQAGYQVAKTVTDKAAAYLEQYKFEDSTDDLATQAFALYSLAVSGENNPQPALALAASADNLDSFSLAALALALHLQGEQDAANPILDKLLAGLEEKDGKAFFPLFNEDGQYHNKTMASAVRTTALAMEALIKIRPQDSRIREMESYLMSMRSDFGWGTTNETAFSVLALTSRLEQLQNDPRPVDYTLSINGATRSGGTLAAGSSPLTLEIPAQDLDSGPNLFHLSVQAGGAPLYFTVTSHMSVPEAAATPAGNVKLERVYLTTLGKPILDLHPGDLVQVRLSFTLPEKTSYLFIEDNLPGGLEALNEALNTSGPVARSQDNDYNPYVYRYSDLGYNQKEIHGSRVLFFITQADAGMHTITYVARVGRPGNYQAQPVQVSAMYNPARWGRSASTPLEVQP